MKITNWKSIWSLLLYVFEILALGLREVEIFLRIYLISYSNWWSIDSNVILPDFLCVAEINSVVDTWKPENLNSKKRFY